MLSVVACGNSEGRTDAVTTENEATITEQQVDELPLNIIEDNYRNYYEIFVYSFYDTDGDGIGDINGVTQKLDYITEMGFNGIWLMPVMPSPTYHKYDVTDYKDIDAAYGSLDDFENMLAECHKRNIRVIIDFVINHTSSKHEWFTTACSYLQTLQNKDEPDLSVCPYVDYYHFEREKKDGTYYQVGNTEWYYEGSFWSEMPDLNLESTLVKKEIEDISDFWIEKGVDGFRMDAAIHYSETDKNFNIETLNWLYTYCKEKNPDFYMVSEIWANEMTIKDYYASMTPSMFNFDLADAEGKIVKAARGKYKASNLVKQMVKYQEDFSAKNPNYIDAPFVNNHDTGRAATVLQSDQNDIKMAAGLLLMMNGSPFVYYGEEIGMPSSGKKDENKRLPMYWSEESASGMTKGPKDADQNISSKFGSVEEQMEDPSSILNYYRKALKLRNQNPEIARGTIDIVEELTQEHIAVITKTYENSVVSILYNTGDEPISLSLKDTVVAQMNLAGYLTVNDEIVEHADQNIILPPQSIAILK